MTAWDLLRAATAPSGGRVPDREPAAVDWEHLQSLAETHHLVPALTANADRFGSVPEEVAEALRIRARAQVQRSLQLSSELHAVLDTLDEAAVPAIPYKGPVLSEVAHGDPGARQYGDVDLVVSPDDFDRACAALETDGYRATKALNALGETVLETGDGAVVEVHSHLLPKFFPTTLPFADVWRRRSSVEVGGRQVPALAPADRFLVLCVHGTRHHWCRLGWVHDVATLVAGDQVPWDDVRARAADLRCERHLLVGCWLARELYDVSLPKSVAAGIDGDETVPTLGARAVTLLEDHDSPTPTERAEYSYQWRALRTRADRLRFALNLATIPSADDVASVDLPEPLNPLYRVVRPTRLAVRFGRRWIRSTV